MQEHIEKEGNAKTFYADVTGCDFSITGKSD